MEKDMDVVNLQEIGKDKNAIQDSWKEIVRNPGILTDLSEKTIVFAAGGGLVTRFGSSESQIWKSMTESADENGNVTIAGIEFGISDLSEMGDYYRFLKEEGYNFHCIDERLEGDEQHLEDEVHEKCGACAAVGAATNLADVEDSLLSELGQKAKQEVYADLPDHESMTILVDLRGSDVVLGDKRQELKKVGGLPFNVSLSLNNIEKYGKNSNRDTSTLIESLVKWNVQIARNIIGGDHNTLQSKAGDTIIIVDSRGVENHSLRSSVETNIAKVDHGLYLQIK